MFLQVVFFHNLLALIIRYYFFEFLHHHLLHILHVQFFYNDYILQQIMFFQLHLDLLHSHLKFVLFLLDLVYCLIRLIHILLFLHHIVLLLLCFHIIQHIHHKYIHLVRATIFLTFSCAFPQNEHLTDFGVVSFFAIYLLHRMYIYSMHSFLYFLFSFVHYSIY